MLTSDKVNANGTKPDMNEPMSIVMLKNISIRTPSILCIFFYKCFKFKYKYLEIVEIFYFIVFREKKNSKSQVF